MNKQSFEWIHRKRQQNKLTFEKFTLDQAKKVHAFHQSFSEYTQTPLVSLENLAKELNIKKLLVKDEDHRFGLHAFKVLGGSFAIGSYLMQNLGISNDKMTCSRLLEADVKNTLGELTFITATDGNHGRGVAWAAKRLQQKAVVYMPQGTAIERLNNIRAEGAKAEISEMNYDDTVRYCNTLAQQNAWTIVQDTAWNGYTQIPMWIMQGYLTMVYEAYCQLVEKPTHIFIQAGVGSVAGTVQAFLQNIYGDKCPIVTVVEPTGAACLYHTAKANDQELHFVKDLQTIMAGLACGEPNPLAWEILNSCSDNFITCPDYVAAQGMRILANPIGDDNKIIAGESGAVGVGLVAEVLRRDDLLEFREALQLDEQSVVLCFNTEGATDQENYRKIVWDGAYARC